MSSTPLMEKTWLPGKTSEASAGVSTTPIRLETDALHSAEGTSPLAMEVKAIEDCTVEGRSDRKIRPDASAAGRNGRAALPTRRPRTGNSRKVLAKTNDWRRQWVRPAHTAWGDRRAPYRK